MKSYRIKHSEFGFGTVFGQSWDCLSSVPDYKTMIKEIKKLKKAGFDPDSITVKFDDGVIRCVRFDDVDQQKNLPR